MTLTASQVRALGVASAIIILVGTIFWCMTTRRIADDPAAASTQISTSTPEFIPTGWTKYDKQGFTAYFKNSLGVPQTDMYQENGAANEDFSAIPSRSGKGMLVTQSTLKPEVFTAMKRNRDACFAAAAEKMIDGGKIISAIDIDVDGDIGREYQVQIASGNDAIIRMVLAHGRLYIYGVIERGINRESENYCYFFDSVKLKP